MTQAWKYRLVTISGVVFKVRLVDGEIVHQFHMFNREYNHDDLNHEFMWPNL
jgi:hypothetical protein